MAGEILSFLELQVQWEAVVISRVEWYNICTELILMYRDIGEYISNQSENTEYGDAFVQKLADFFAMNYPDLRDSLVVDFIE